MNICALAAYGNKGKIAKQPTKDCEGATDTSTKDQVIQTHTHTRATQHTHATRACLNKTPKLMHTCMQASGANIARETFELPTCLTTDVCRALRSRATIKIGADPLVWQLQARRLCNMHWCLKRQGWI